LLKNAKFLLNIGKNIDRNMDPRSYTGRFAYTFNGTAALQQFSFSSPVKQEQALLCGRAKVPTLARRQLHT
jgi:hypothetical protein